MKLEAGKYYKTRDGRKAYVGYVREDDCQYPAVGHMDGGGVDCWLARGGYVDKGGTHFNDLIEEWVEPRSGALWVNIYPDGAIFSHESRPRADQANSMTSDRGKRLACVKVYWAEGQFDE